MFLFLIQFLKKEVRLLDIRTLQEALDCGIINEDTLQQQLIMKQKEALLKRHPYAITLLSCGRWQTYYIDPATGKRKELKASSKEKLTDKLLLKIKESSHIENFTMTMLYEQWLSYKTSITSSQNTVKRHKQHFKKYFEHTELFKTPISKIDKIELQSFCNRLVKDYNMSSKEWTNVKTILKGMFEYAVDKELIDKSPMEKVRITVKFRQIQRKTGKTETFNTQERKELDAYLDKMYQETGDLTFLAVKLNFYLGLRVGELVTLKAEDRVDLKHLHIQREEVRDQENNRTYVVEHTKGNKDRFVPLVPKAIVLLNKIMEKNVGKGFLFTRNGERITARQIAYVLEKYAERTGHTMKSSHKIRKTVASNLNAEAVPLDEIRELLGHSDLQTTLAYIYNPLTEEETYERIKKAL